MALRRYVDNARNQPLVGEPRRQTISPASPTASNSGLILWLKKVDTPLITLYSIMDGANFILMLNDCRAASRAGCGSRVLDKLGPPTGPDQRSQQTAAVRRAKSRLGMPKAACWARRFGQRTLRRLRMFLFRLAVIPAAREGGPILSMTWHLRRFHVHVSQTSRRMV